MVQPQLPARLTPVQALDHQDAIFEDLGFYKSINRAGLHSYSKDLTKPGPVLVFLHGYPQSSLMWRLVIRELLNKAAAFSENSIPMFVPDLPGYGGSTTIQLYDNLHVGKAVLSELKELYREECAQEGQFLSGSEDEAWDLKVIMIGHDRGAHVAHCMAVAGFMDVGIGGICVLNTYPLKVEFDLESQNTIIAPHTFYWHMLAHVNTANELIHRMGGPHWCALVIQQLSGRDRQRLMNLQRDDALSVYCGFFSNPAVINATNTDHKASRTVDLRRVRRCEERDTLKITCPVLSISNRTKPEHIEPWENYIGRLDLMSFADDPDPIMGYYMAEENPEKVVEVLWEWLQIGK